MTTAQRIIKYLAIAFAIFLIVNIVSAIIFGIYIFADLLGLRKHSGPEYISSIEGEKIVSDFTNQEIDTLKIDLQTIRLVIKEGDSLKVESSSDKVSCKKSAKKLEIKEKGSHWMSTDNTKNVVVVYIPTDMEFTDIDIDTNAGQVNIDTLRTEVLSLDIGAGKLEIQNLYVTQRAKIDGGAGSGKISNGKIVNLDLDMGVGKFDITTQLKGSTNKIDAGIGQLNIQLTDSEDNYKMKVNKGIGSIKINNKELSDNETYGQGETLIKIDGGIGVITVKNLS